MIRIAADGEGRQPGAAERRWARTALSQTQTHGTEPKRPREGRARAGDEGGDATRRSFLSENHCRTNLHSSAVARRRSKWREFALSNSRHAGKGINDQWGDLTDQGESHRSMSLNPLIRSMSLNPWIPQISVSESPCELISWR